jgi:uncharacterized protein
MEVTQAIPTRTTLLSKALGVIETVIVLAAILGANTALAQTPLYAWQESVLGHSFTGHTLFILVPIILLILSRRSLKEYGISFAGGKSWLTAALTAFLPVAVVSATLGFVNYTSWWGAVVESLAFLAALWFVARALTGKPNPQSGLLTIFLALVLFGAYGIWQGKSPGIAKGLVNVLFYCFVGFGEEILYRGYIQSRLNAAFGKPFQFFGACWGYGTLIAALLFGLTHTLNGINIVTGEVQLLWWWGVWTFFSGLLFAYVREKTGTVAPGAVLHALPQALVTLMVDWQM